ncbi:hypothetical protein AQF52_6722 [Streptomyces venezuelae]|uniref:hypothetical protein n=1 Tax=Streptomyces gardneri TaxID=66892 RepID=UPI0006BDE183|nr:hypothetical protein [Streptomyces gardneri]ALO12315.1 hypothetical protein AQF52_6722 [Streptomyces venezuelae]QPK49115.1 hypothetical protein H4W23_33765 [Streptomyces gardneri]WRK40615.1 hypothetical protein U0M97_33925 [Streptomyces venezuelae]CUM37090.1 hypothetical protein BN2537_3145 [Streptomyces venezuelae]
MPRLLNGTVRVEGVDHEDFTANEHPTDKVRFVQIVLDSGQPAQNLFIAPVKWGGECRVEVELNAMMLDNNAIKITGNSKFFEGASEETGEMEDQVGIDFTVPRTTGGSPPRHHHVSLRNQVLIGAEDSAEVFFDFSNLVVEDD